MSKPVGESAEGIRNYDILYHPCRKSRTRFLGKPFAYKYVSYYWATMDTRSSFSSPSPYRRRRMIWCFILVFTVVFFFGAPWEMPGYLKDLDQSLGFSRANIVKLA